MPRPSDTEFSRPRPRTPAPHINPVPLWPTPEKRDLLFYVERNGDLKPNQIWSYGDAYIDPITYPNHKLVFVTPQTPDSWSKWYYAADRIEEGEYNWSFSDADVGGTKYKTAERVYLTPREDFDPLVPAMGATMADTPYQKFTETYVLAIRQQVDVPDEVFRSLYVTEKRVYIKKVPLVDIEINRETGEAKAITTTLYYRGEVVTGIQTIEDLVADEEDPYWDLDADGYGRVAKQLSENWWEVTHRQWINLDDIWEWEWDRRKPGKYLCPRGSTKRTVITTGNPLGPIADEDLPVVLEGQAIQIIQWGEIIKVTTIDDIGTVQDLHSLNLMQDDGVTYPVLNELVEQAAVPLVPGGIDGNGIVEEYEEVDGCNSARITRQAISLEEATTLAQDGLYPEKFIKNQEITETTITETGELDAPTLPAFADGESVTVEQKGRIRKTKTVLQEGDLTPLPGLVVDESDGNIYPSTDEVIPLIDVPDTVEEVASTGIGIIYEPIDADLAVKRTRQIVSVQPKDKLVADRLAPDKFLLNGGIEAISIETQPASGVIPTSIGADNYKRVTMEQKGSMRTVETVSQFSEPQTLNGTTFDERTGEGFIETQDLVAHSSVTATEVTNEGLFDSYQPINPHFAVKTVRKVASTTTRIWQEIINYEWPPVLTEIQYETYEKRSGGLLVIPTVIYKEGFQGPQIATATQYWQKPAISPVSPQQMIPQGFRFGCPYFTIDAPPCLHESITFSAVIGTDDPIWLPATYVRNFAATNLTDWPVEIQWIESKPHRGGYLVTEWVIPSPST